MLIALEDSEADVAAALEGVDPTILVLMDGAGRLASPYGVSAIPTTVVVDAAGGIADIRVGPITAAELQAMVDAAR